MLLVVAATEPELRSVVDDHDVTTLVCGVGPVDAAVMTTWQLSSTEQPRALVHVGIAGCRRGSGHAIGDVVIGSSARYCDTSSQLVEQQVEPDATLFELVRSALPGAATAVIGTSGDVGGTAHATGCNVEAMEGFAVLRAAAVLLVPAVEVRVVANEIEEEDRARWNFAGALTRLDALLPDLVAAIRAGDLLSGGTSNRATHRRLPGVH